jgi:catechol 2,3-dioxygenase-like lactoylglutathione lyase family enzyme
VIIGLFHPGYTVSNLEQSLQFYGQTLGIEHLQSQVSDQPYLSSVTGIAGCSLKIGFARIEGDQTPFELLEFVKPGGQQALTGFGIIGTPHLCYQVDNLSAVYRRLAQQGVKFCGEPHLLGDGPWGEATGVFLLDPDGLLVELIELGGNREAAGRLVRLHHIGLTVSKLEQAIEVLCRQMGLLEQVKYACDSAYIRHQALLADSSMRVAVLLIPNTEIYVELWEFRSSGEPAADITSNNVGSAHVCLLVDNIMADHALLSRRGIQFVGPPVEVTAGVNKGGFAIYCLGPDNIRFELFQKPGAT